MSWEYDLAGEFKSRNNPKLIGACVGVVSSVFPFKGSILNGQILLDDTNTYVCDTLLERKSKMTFKGTHIETGEITIAGLVSNGTYDEKGNTNVTAEIHLEEVLKVGDLVMVVPSFDEQTFFVVDIVKEA